MKRLLAPLCLLLLSASTPCQTPKNPETRKEDLCKISGSVVKLAGDEPLRKAQVQLRSEEERPRTISTVTNAGGLFILRGIEPGRYRLTVGRNGFVAQAYGQRKPTDPGAVLTLRPGQEIKDLLFRLIPSAVIAGRILDEDGEPLPSVNVSALHQVYHEGKLTLATSTAVASNDLGEYRLFGLPPGRYLITAVYTQWNRFGVGEDSDAAETQEEGYAKMYYPGTPDAGRAMPLAIKAGEEVPSIDILMRKVRVYHVRGHVYNLLTKKAAMDANVFLVARGRNLEWEFDNQQSTAQKKDGSFDISEVRPGSYVVAAYWFDEGKPMVARVPVDVGNADVDGVSLTLGSGVNIPGRIIWDGQPSLEENELNVVPMAADIGRNFWGIGGARVDATNSFVIKDLGDGIYFAELRGLSKDCYVKEVRYGSSSALDDGFTVARGTPASLEITISSRGATIQGSVADEDGLPAAGVQVVIVPELSRRSLHRLYKSVTTDQYGHFKIRGIAPGDYSLFSWEEVESGAWEDPEFIKPFEAKGEKISVQDADQKTMNLTAIRTRTAESSKP